MPSVSALCSPFSSSNTQSRANTQPRCLVPAKARSKAGWPEKQRPWPAPPPTLANPQPGPLFLFCKMTPLVVGHPGCAKSPNTKKTWYSVEWRVSPLLSFWRGIRTRAEGLLPAAPHNYTLSSRNPQNQEEKAVESDREGLGANQKKGALTVSGPTPLKSLHSDFIHRGIGESGRASSGTWRVF